LSETKAMTALSESGAPAFREPWQAKAFAMVVLLHRQGRFEWNEWVQVLGAEIAASPSNPTRIRMLPIIGNSSLRSSGSLPHWALPTQATSCGARRNGAAPTSTRRTAMQSSCPLHAQQRAMQTVALEKPVARCNAINLLRSFDRLQSAPPRAR